MCVIAIDFDGTISANFAAAAAAIKKLKEKGHIIVIWSSRNNPRQHGTQSEKLLREMIVALEENNIPYDEIDYGYSGKYHAQVYIDDKCWRFENNWDEIIEKIY